MTFFMREFGGSMTTSTNGASVKSLKREARKLQKALGITYHAALNQLAAQAGLNGWKKLKEHCEPTVNSKIIQRPPIPVPAIIKCYDIIKGNLIGERPNCCLPITRHTEIGLLLQEVLNFTHYHRRAHKVINEIILKMDNWMGCEYDERVLPTEQFNKIYIGHRQHLLEPLTAKRTQLKLKRKLRKAKVILEKGYHDCRPVRQLFDRFELAFKTLDKWPRSIRVPAYKERKVRLLPGTFVNKKGSKKLIMVFSHNMRLDIVEGYSDSGYFVAGRHEVIPLKKPVEISHFKPMRLYLPYGKWTLKDGTEILFNRDYCPMWQKNKVGTVTGISPTTDVIKESSEFYFDDRTAPYYRGNIKHLRNCQAILKNWGVDQKLPAVFELFPAAIAAGDAELLSPKGFS